MRRSCRTTLQETLRRGHDAGAYPGTVSPPEHSDLTTLLESAKEQHTAIDDDDHYWADWYAGYLADHVGRFGIDADDETLSAWLIEAEQAHQSEEPDAPWPQFYARFLLRAARRGPR
jgi:hypothetical protein